MAPFKSSVPVLQHAQQQVLETDAVMGIQPSFIYHLFSSVLSLLWRSETVFFGEKYELCSPVGCVSLSMLWCLAAPGGKITISVPLKSQPVLRYVAGSASNTASSSIAQTNLDYYMSLFPHCCKWNNKLLLLFYHLSLQTSQPAEWVYPIPLSDGRPFVSLSKLLFK